MLSSCYIWQISNLRLSRTFLKSKWYKLQKYLHSERNLKNELFPWMESKRYHFSFFPPTRSCWPRGPPTPASDGGRDVRDPALGIRPPNLPTQGCHDGHENRKVQHQERITGSNEPLLPTQVNERSLLNTAVLPSWFNISHSCFRQKSHWGDDADTFRPERFLSSDGKSTVMDDWLQPFGYGE